MSDVQAYYWAHSREFSYGRISPLGLGAGSLAFAAFGLAMMFRQIGGVYDALMAVGVLGMLLSLVDVGVAALVGPRPASDVPAARQPRQTRTFTTDRQVVVASLLCRRGHGNTADPMFRAGHLQGADNGS